MLRLKGRCPLSVPGRLSIRKCLILFALLSLLLVMKESGVFTELSIPSSRDMMIRMKQEEEEEEAVWKITNLGSNASRVVSTDKLQNYSAMPSAFHNVSSSLKDEFPFRYLINEPDFCESRSDLYIINLVGTAPWEVMARARIRRLWGNETWRSMTGFSTVFLIGETQDQSIMSKVKKESLIFHDIILLNFIDSYDNLTFKTLSGFHWVENYCQTAVWVLKSDADVVVNTFELNKYLRDYDKRTKFRRDHFICKRRRSTTPCRKNCRHVKWRVPWEEYPHDRYPPYCMGPGYIVPRKLIGPVLRASNKTHPFRMEDVYYTGIVRVSIKKPFIDIESISHRFPWRPRTWQASFVSTDLMILELDQRVGRGASSLVWTNILKNLGLLPTSARNNKTNIEDTLNL